MLLGIAKKWLWAVILFGVAFSGCEADSPTTPESQELALTQPVIEETIDEVHFARVVADRTFTINNVAFVLQHDPADPKHMGVTLISRRSNEDGSRLVFGSLEPTQSMDQLAAGEIYMSTPRFLNLKGNGVFTQTNVYQPKFAALKIQSFDAKEVRGTITGDFYRFARANSFSSATIQKMELSFNALRVDK